MTSGSDNAFSLAAHTTASVESVSYSSESSPASGGEDAIEISDTQTLQKAIPAQSSSEKTSSEKASSATMPATMPATMIVWDQKESGARENIKIVETEIPADQAARKISNTHFVVFSAPVGESLLILYPGLSLPQSENAAADMSDLARAKQQNSDGTGAAYVAALSKCILRFYDPDGLQFNEINLELNTGTTCVLELEPFLSGCKYESGLKYAHLEVIAPAYWQAVCRIVNSQGATLSGPCAVLNGSRREFLPVSFHAQRETFIFLVNMKASPGTVRGRFFCGRRSPEGVWQLPAKGCRVVSLVHDFAEFIEGDLSEPVQGYIRFGVRGDFEVGMQMLERALGAQGASGFAGLA